jgi:hypothetical protein
MTQTKEETPSGAHRDHNGVLGEDGDRPKRLDHGDGGGGGSLTCAEKTMAAWSSWAVEAGESSQ